MLVGWVSFFVYLRLGWCGERVSYHFCFSCGVFAWFGTGGIWVWVDGMK